MERLKVLLIGAAVVALLGLAWKSASNALASDEERIRARLESMVDGFNANTVRHVVRDFDRGYRDEGTGADRDELVSALQGLFFRDLTSGGENYRVEIPPAELDIAVAEGGRSARSRKKSARARASSGGTRSRCSSGRRTAATGRSPRAPTSTTASAAGDRRSQ